MNDPRPAFMFNVVEFWSSEKVDAMDADAIGVYLLLLSRQWQNGSIPGDPAEIERMAKRRLVRAWADVWPQVEACFPLGEDGRRRNARLECERGEADRRSASASAAVKARWQKWKDRDGDTPVYGRSTTEVRSNSTPVQGQGQGQDRDRTVPIATQSGGAPAPQPSEVRASTEKKPKPSKPKTPSEHQPVVEAWVRAWAFYRHEMSAEAVRAWTFEAPDSIPKERRYVLHERDWVAAAKLWKLTDGNLAEIKRRMNRMMESTVAWVANNPSLGLLEARWNEFDRALLDRMEASA